MLDDKKRDWIETEVVDKVGIGYTLAAIGDICALKAQHLRENWQDEKQAEIWDRIGREIDNCRGALSFEFTQIFDYRD